MWETITSNYIINVGFVSWSLAQIIKTILTLCFTRRITLERLTGAGGMPSSHSALTVSVATAMLRKTGFASPEFALAITLAVIVMYDAMGVRRAAGEHAKVLNKIVFEFANFPLFGKRDEKYVESSIENIASEEPSQPSGKEKPYNQLQELLGHTPFEVLAGIILGITIAFVIPFQ